MAKMNGVDLPADFEDRPIDIVSTYRHRYTVQQKLHLTVIQEDERSYQAYITLLPGPNTGVY